MWRLALIYLSLVINSAKIIAQDLNFECFLNTLTDSTLHKVFQNPNKFKVQIIYSRPEGNKSFKDYSYRINHNEYFYPASLVKLPLSILTYEKLKELNLNPEYQLITEGSFAPKANYLCNDSTHFFLSCKDHIIRCFSVSDNHSPNYLYEFLGHEYIQKKLNELNFNKLHINQRFARADTSTHKTTHKVKITTHYGDTLYQQMPLISPLSIHKNYNHVLGKAHVNSHGKMVFQPMNFNTDNYLALDQLHQLWKEICYPNITSKLKMSKEQKLELKKISSLTPNQTEYPNYYHFPDNYRKFLFYGDSNITITPNIQIANKVGLAYGCISDVAYYKNALSGVEFSLSCVLYVNSNDIINDGKYEYDKIGLPFLGKLGREIISFENFIIKFKNRDILFTNKNINYTIRK